MTWPFPKIRYNLWFKVCVSFSYFNPFSTSVWNRFGTDYGYLIWKQEHFGYASRTSGRLLKECNVCVSNIRCCWAISTNDLWWTIKFSGYLFTLIRTFGNAMMAHVSLKLIIVSKSTNDCIRNIPIDFLPKRIWLHRYSSHFIIQKSNYLIFAQNSLTASDCEITELERFRSFPINTSLNHVELSHEETQVCKKIVSTFYY